MAHLTATFWIFLKICLCSTCSGLNLATDSSWGLSKKTLAVDSPLASSSLGDLRQILDAWWLECGVQGPCFGLSFSFCSSKPLFSVDAGSRQVAWSADSMARY